MPLKKYRDKKFSQSSLNVYFGLLVAAAVKVFDFAQLFGNVEHGPLNTH